jgi:meromycolic acid enoyl-[acyl-carrier-protein] reductase
MSLLDGKRILVTGVLTDASLAFGVARHAQEQGAEVILTGAGRGLSLTQRTARKLPQPADVLELDVTVPEQVASVRDEIGERWDRVDGALHAIGFAPPSCLGGDFTEAPWEDVSVALQISTYSLKVLADVVVPHMHEGGSIVGLDFDNSRVAWPVYDWMGVAKTALESTSRYLARDLGPKGIRVNLVAAGPLRTLSEKSIPGASQFEDVWTERAPLGWDIKDAEPVAKACVALLSDWFPATTGEILHVDGGVHAIGA